MNDAIDMLEKVGPRGGNLNSDYNPAKPEWRKENIHAEVLPDGSLGSHRFVRDYDTSAPGIKNEQPWHTMAAYMLNSGRTNSEIALAAGVSVGHVSHLRSQKWFQERCAIIANTEGEEILGLIRSETAASIEKIVQIRDDANAGARANLAAAMTLLEHAHGKPTQKIISDNTNRNHYSSPEDEKSAIDAELAALRSSREIST